MIPINKRSIGSCIILSLITFGIYSIYWEYLLVKNTRAIKKDDSSCTGEMLCLIFVPFYSLYWWFTRGKLVRDEFSKHGYSASSNETVFLVLALFGLGIVAMAIMQKDFNSLPSESTQSDQQSAGKGLNPFKRFIMPALSFAGACLFIYAAIAKHGMKNVGFLIVAAVIMIIGVIVRKNPAPAAKTTEE